MNKREIKIDILSQLVAYLEKSVMNIETQDDELDKVFKMQAEVAQELERRIARLSRSK